MDNNIGKIIALIVLLAFFIWIPMQLSKQNSKGIKKMPKLTTEQKLRYKGGL